VSSRLARRTLPIRVPIADGESLHSWVEALARRHRMTVRELLPALGLESPRTPYGLIRGIPATRLRSIENQAGLPAGRLDDAVLDQFAALGLVGDAVPGPPSERWHLWTRASGARFCPRCLDETGGRWALSWHLIWSFACTRHRVVLAARCGSCGQVPRSAENRFDHLLDGNRCCHASPAHPRSRPGPGMPRCGSLLTGYPVQVLSARHPVLRSQMWIDRILAACLDSDRQMTMAGQSVPAAVAFAAVATLIRYVLARDEDLGGRRLRYMADALAGQGLRLSDRDISRPVGETYSTAVREPALFGVAAALALDVLAAPSLDAAADTMAWLGSGTVQYGDHPGAISIALFGGPGSPLVDAIVLRACAPKLSVAYRMSYMTESAVPSRPATDRYGTRKEGWPFSPDGLASLPARLVPQAVWRSVADVLPSHASQDTTAFRCAISMALVRCGTYTEWAHIAAQLMLPRQLSRTVTYVWRHLARAGYLTEVLTGINSLVDVLIERPPPIDYARRRWVFREVELVPASRLRAACHHAGLVATDRRRRFATMLLWETLTGGDIRVQSGELVPRDADDRTEYASFCKREALDLSDYFAVESERLLLRHRINEPVTWQPEFLGPRGPQWGSPPPDITRRLPGWVSPSRLGTLRRSARDHTPTWWALLESEDFRIVNDVAVMLFHLAACPLMVEECGVAGMPFDMALEIQARNEVALIEARQGRYQPTADGLAFMAYWTTAQPLLRYDWTECPWGSIGHDFQSGDERWWSAVPEYGAIVAVS
jgi:hypothetical protein